MVYTMISYVNGFMIQPEQQRVLFIRKNRPAFQAGKWNGIGGKIEPGESAIDAMVREFREETGVATAPESWERTIALQGRDFVVYFYRSFVDTFPAYHTPTDEVVNDWPIEAVFRDEKFGIPTLPNMKWILPMQLNLNIKFPLLVEWRDSH
jgi:8-oxo-dGTP diphosphatase